MTGVLRCNQNAEEPEKEPGGDGFTVLFLSFC